MKKLYFFLGFLFTVTLAPAQLLTENFSYTAGQLLTANGWTAHSGTGTNSIAVTSPGLTYTGHAGSGIGNATTMTTSGEDVNRTFTAITSGNAYLSFLINVSAAQATGDYSIGLFQTTSIFPVRVYIKSDGSGFNFGVSKGNNPVVYETAIRSFGTTYFIVANYVYNAATTSDDVVNLWVNPALGGSEPAPAIANVSGTASGDATTIGAVYLRQGSAANASTQQIDAILVGATWATVTPGSGSAPGLTATTVSDFGSVNVGSNSTSQSFTISGSNLTGAPGNITITAPSTDFQVSNNNSTWGASTTIPYTSATLAATTAYVRFTPQSAGLKSGNVTITGGGGNASVAVSGTGTAVGGPPAAPVATTASAVTATGFTANWNPVSGATKYFLDVYTLTTGTITDTVAGWNFATNTAANQTADEGNVNNVGIQTVTPTGLNTISWPSGPSGATGSPNPFSVSANGWDNGADTKYWSIDVNTTGATNIRVSSLQGSSSTGPKDFKLQYRVGATGTWTDVTGGTVTLTTGVVAGNLATWGALTDLALPANASNQALISIRWINTSTTSVSGATVAAGGTSRISAIYIKGDVGGGSTPLYVPGYQNLDVGNVTSYNVTGLSNNTTYYYVVRASNASGTSGNSNEISVTTTASVVPTLTAGALTAFGNICVNNTVGPNSFTLSGTNLTTADIVIGALAGYTYDTVATGPYYSTLTLPHAAGSYTKTIYVKFRPTAVQSYNGNIPITGGGVTGTVNVAASGAGVNTGMVVNSGSASVTTNSATVTGLIPSTGCEPITSYGIAYSLTSGFTTGTQVASTNLSGGSFTSLLSGLASSTTYYYKAYAVTASGTTYGSELSFTTTAPPPSLAATALTAFGNICINTSAGPNSFTLTGANLTSANIVIAALAGYSFDTVAAGPHYSSLTLPHAPGAYSKTIYVKFTPTAVQSYNGNIVITGGGTTGSLNVVASGSGVNTAPTVSTGTTTNVTLNAATLSGSVTTNGCAATTGFGIEYSTVNNFAPGTGNQVTATGTAASFTANVTGLVPNTTYYYRAYALNAGGNGYGTQQSFTTASLRQGFTIYPVPARRGAPLNISMTDVTPGFYAVMFRDMKGELVHQENINVQASYIFQAVMLPETLARGTYSVQLIRETRVVLTRMILVLEN